MIIAILIALQAFLIYVPFMQEIFHTADVNFYYGWWVPTVCGLIVLAVTEVVKLTRLHIAKLRVKKNKLGGA